MPDITTDTPTSHAMVIVPVQVGTHARRTRMVIVDLIEGAVAAGAGTSELLSSHPVTVGARSVAPIQRAVALTLVVLRIVRLHPYM